MTRVRRQSAQARFLMVAVLLLFALTLSHPVSTSAQDENFPNGVAAGDTTPTSVVLWARIATAGTVTFAYSTDASFATDVTTLPPITVTDPLLPAKGDVTGLTPGTTYYYRATDDDDNMAMGTFRTPAETGTRTGLRFGVSGDWRGDLAPYPAIANTAERDLDFFILHGDTTYADVPSPAVPISQTRTLEEYRRKHAEGYGERLNINHWAEVRASTSIYATIDDHEITNDFAGGASVASDAQNPGNGITPGQSRFGSNTDTDTLINDSQLYETGMQAYHEYNPVREERYADTGSDPRTDGEYKLYRYRTFGSDAAVIILDNRSFRDAQLPNPTGEAEIAAFLLRSFDIDPVTLQPLPPRTMLSERQLATLLQDVQRAQDAGITWNFILTPEPIQNLGPVEPADRFEGYAAERTRILKFINDNQIDNVVFIAADIHGTLVNDLTYQEPPNLGPAFDQIQTSAFEISTGAVAYHEPLGPTVVDIAVNSGLVPENLLPLIGIYNLQPTAEGRDQIFIQFVNFVLGEANFSLIGLDDSPLDERTDLRDGGYIAAHTYGWTEFEIDAETQALTITTYGVDSYSQADLTYDPSLAEQEPRVMSQFVVTPINAPMPDQTQRIYIPLVQR